MGSRRRVLVMACRSCKAVLEPRNDDDRPSHCGAPMWRCELVRTSHGRLLLIDKDLLDSAIAYGLVALHHGRRADA